MWKADLMSVFARKYRALNELIFLIVSSIVAYCTEDSSLGMLSFTEDPSGKDK